MSQQPKKQDRKSWNSPDQRRTGSAGGGEDRSCMSVAVPAAIIIGLVVVELVRGLR
jgi:hypothetical protein